MERLTQILTFDHSYVSPGAEILSEVSTGEYQVYRRFHFYSRLVRSGGLEPPRPFDH